MFGRNPAVWFAALAAIAQGVWIFATSDPTATLAVWAAPLLTIAAGWLGNRAMVSKKEIRDAGESPESIEARAKQAPRL